MSSQNDGQISIPSVEEVREAFERGFKTGAETTIEVTPQVAIANVRAVVAAISDPQRVLIDIDEKAFGQSLIPRDQVQTMALELAQISLRIANAVLEDLEGANPPVRLVELCCKHGTFPSSAPAPSAFIREGESPASIDKIKQLRIETAELAARYMDPNVMYRLMAEFIHTNRTTLGDVQLSAEGDFTAAFLSLRTYFETGDEIALYRQFEAGLLPTTGKESVLAAAAAISSAVIAPLKTAIDWSTPRVGDVFSNIVNNFISCFTLFAFAYQPPHSES